MNYVTNGILRTLGGILGVCLIIAVPILIIDYFIINITIGKMIFVCVACICVLGYSIGRGE